IVRHATDTAVSASISTPVGPVTLTAARTMQPGSLASVVMSSVTFERASGWHSGISSEVRFAARFPAPRPGPSPRPFFALPETISASVALLMTTRPSATAVRSVAGLAETSTIRASPLASIWVSAGSALGAGLLLDDGRAMRSARPGRVDAIAARQQGAGRRRHIGLPHQAFADQEGRHAHAREPRKIGRLEDAALADHQAISGDQRRQRLAGRKRGLEGAQVAVIDADHRRTKLQCALEFSAVMDFDQDIHAERNGRVFDIPGRGVVERRHDDQDAVSAVSAGLDHLIGVVDEILA